MATRNPAHQLRNRYLKSHYLQGFHNNLNGAWPWDFWTINRYELISYKKPPFQFQSQSCGYGNNIWVRTFPFFPWKDLEASHLPYPENHGILGRFFEKGHVSKRKWFIFQPSIFSGYVSFLGGFWWNIAHKIYPSLESSWWLVPDKKHVSTTLRLDFLVCVCSSLNLHFWFCLLRQSPSPAREWFHKWTADRWIMTNPFESIWSICFCLWIWMEFSWYHLPLMAAHRPEKIGLIRVTPCSTVDAFCSDLKGRGDIYPMFFSASISAMSFLHVIPLDSIRKQKNKQLENTQKTRKETKHSKADHHVQVHPNNCVKVSPKEAVDERWRSINAQKSPVRFKNGLGFLFHGYQLQQSCQQLWEITLRLNIVTSMSRKVH